MSVSDVRAGRAFVELFLKNNMTKGLAIASRQLKSFGAGTTKVGSNLMGFGTRVTALGATMASAFIAPIKAAGDLMETTSKFNSVFAENADGVRSWMDEYRAQIGRGAKEAMDGMAAFGAFFQGMGKGGDEAAELSKKMLQLSMDFASFHNIADTEAQERFISALSGSSQVLDMFGINIKQSALDLKLLAMGFPTVAKGADETQKMMARLAIIEESMGRQGALNDATKTAGSFSNQMKRLRGSLMDTAAAIGNALLPVVTPLVTKASELVLLFSEWAQNNAGIIQTVAKVAIGITAAGAALVVAGAALVGIGSTFSALGAIVGVLGTGLALIVSPIGLITVGLTAGLAAWALWTESGQSAVSSLGELFESLSATFAQTWGGIMDALKGGDLALAAKIAWAGLQVAWYKGTEGIYKTWMGLKNNLLDAWNDLHTSLAKTFTNWAAGFQKAWVNVLAAIRSGMLEAKDTGKDLLTLNKLAWAVAEIRQRERNGTITHEQAEKEKAAAQKVFFPEISQREAERQEKLKAIEKARAKETGDIDEAARRELDRFDKENQDAKNKRTAEYEKGLKEREDALRAAQAELDSRTNVRLYDDTEKKKGVAAVGAAREGAVKAMVGGSFGSFSASALLAGARGNIPQQQLAVAKQQLKVEQEIAQKMAAKSGQTIQLVGGD